MVISRQLVLQIVMGKLQLVYHAAVWCDGSVYLLTQAKPVAVVQTPTVAGYQDTQQQQLRILVKWMIL